MNNNQIDPNQESNQLSDNELEQVAGGTLRDVANEFVEGVKETGKAIVDTAEDVKDALLG